MNTNINCIDYYFLFAADTFNFRIVEASKMILKTPVYLFSKFKEVDLLKF